MHLMQTVPNRKDIPPDRNLVKNSIPRLKPKFIYQQIITRIVFIDNFQNTQHSH